MSLWTSYKALAPQTRIFLGLGLMANAALALHFSADIESALGMTPTKMEEEQLARSIPRVSLVDRGHDQDIDRGSMEKAK